MLAFFFSLKLLWAVPQRESSWKTGLGKGNTFWKWSLCDSLGSDGYLQSQEELSSLFFKCSSQNKMPFLSAWLGCLWMSHWLGMAQTGFWHALVFEWSWTDIPISGGEWFPHSLWLLSFPEALGLVLAQGSLSHVSNPCGESTEEGRESSSIRTQSHAGALGLQKALEIFFYPNFDEVFGYFE